MTALKHEVMLDDHNVEQIIVEREFHAYPKLKIKYNKHCFSIKY